MTDTKRESFPGDRLAAFNDAGNVIIAANVEAIISKKVDGNGSVTRENMTVVVLALRRAEKSAPKQFTAAKMLTGVFGKQFAEQAIKVGRNKNAHFEFAAFQIPEGYTPEGYAEALVAHAAKAVKNTQINGSGARRVVLPFGMSLNAEPEGNRQGRLFGAVTFSACNGNLTTQVHLMRRALGGVAMKLAHEALRQGYQFGDGIANGDWVTFTKVEDHTPEKYTVPNSGVEATVNFVYRGYAQPIRLVLKDLIPGQSARPKKSGSKISKKK